MKYRIPYAGSEGKPSSNGLPRIVPENSGGKGHCGKRGHNGRKKEKKLIAYAGRDPHEHNSK